MMPLGAAQLLWRPPPRAHTLARVGGRNRPRSCFLEWQC